MNYFSTIAHIEHRNASNCCYMDTKRILIRVIYQIIWAFVVKNLNDAIYNVQIFQNIISTDNYTIIRIINSYIITLYYYIII